MEMETKELVSVNSILSYLQEQVEKKIPLAPSIWVDASAKLAVLLGDENDKLFDLQQKVAQIRVDYIQQGEGMSVSEAKVRTEATDEYKEFHKQKARVEQVAEFIRIAKLRARITETEYKSY